MCRLRVQSRSKFGGGKVDSVGGKKVFIGIEIVSESYFNFYL